METETTPTFVAYRGSKTAGGGPTRAADNTLALLRSFIFTGQFEAGQRLPSERVLADELGTSRITIGYALRTLETLGFVEVSIGRHGGWWVVDAASLAALWRSWKESNTEEIRLMLESTEVTETAIATLAARRRTTEEKQRLEEILGDFQRTGTIRPHRAFHMTLGQAAHNHYLEETADLVAVRLFMPSDRVLIPEKLAEFHEGHERIVAAVAKGDPEAAREAMKAHYRFSRYVFALDE